MAEDQILQQLLVKTTEIGAEVAKVGTILSEHVKTDEERERRNETRAERADASFREVRQTLQNQATEFRQTITAVNDDWREAMRRSHGRIDASMRIGALMVIGFLGVIAFALWQNKLGL